MARSEGSPPVTEQRRYPYFGIPPARQPRPATEEPALKGKRVILSTPEGFVYDMRAASEKYRDGDGKPIIDIVAEGAWFRWIYTDMRPVAQPYPEHLVWVE
jgi:hypothetical protein